MKDEKRKVITEELPSVGVPDGEVVIIAGIYVPWFLTKGNGDNRKVTTGTQQVHHIRRRTVYSVFPFTDRQKQINNRLKHRVSDSRSEC